MVVMSGGLVIQVWTTHPSLIGREWKVKLRFHLKFLHDLHQLGLNQNHQELEGKELSLRVQLQRLQ